MEGVRGERKGRGEERKEKKTGKQAEECVPVVLIIKGFDTAS